MFKSPGPVIYDFSDLLPFDFALRWYGTLIGLGFFVACSIVFLLVKKESNETQRNNLLDLLFFCFFGGIIGARLWFVVLNATYFLSNPLESVQIWHGGQSIQGGFLGAIVAGLLFYSIKKADGKPNEFLNRYKVCDLLAVALPFGQAIGRWGNFFNNEAFGLPTKLPWALFIPEQSRPFQYIGFTTFHPTFLYEFIYLLACGLLMLFLYKREVVKPGVLLCLYFILYSLGRFAIEFIRIDSLMIGPFAAAHVICFATIAAASFFAYKFSNIK
ncbi:MAG TPA: prolipoprotein diacylglyceryl transferase [Vampirovibrionales bacterium]